MFGIDLNAEPASQSSYTKNKQQKKKRVSFSCKFFETDPNMQPKRHGSSSNSQGGRTHNLIPDLNEEPPASEEQFKNLSRQIPKVFHPYISNTSLQDVEPDGNCGFRSVALGLGLTEDHWHI